MRKNRKSRSLALPPELDKQIVEDIKAKEQDDGVIISFNRYVISILKKYFQKN